MARNESDAPQGGSIDDILRALKPKGVEVPEARAPIPDPLPGESSGPITVKPLLSAVTVPRLGTG